MQPSTSRNEVSGSQGSAGSRRDANLQKARRYVPSCPQGTQHFLLLSSIDVSINPISNLVESPDDFHNHFLIVGVVLDLDRVKLTARSAGYEAAPNE